MAGEEIDVRITMEVRASNIDSENFTVAIEMSDTSSPRIPFESLERFEQVVHDAAVEHVLGIKESWEMDKLVIRPRHPVLQAEHKVCYNKLLREPSR